MSRSGDEISKSFSQEEWAKLLQESIATIESLSTLKGGEYAGDKDRLANFRSAADKFGVPMELIWAIYAGKHWDAIMQYIKDQVHGSTRPRAEPILGRYDDLIVYCLLAKAIFKERHGSANSMPKQDLGMEKNPQKLPLRPVPNYKVQSERNLFRGDLDW